MEIQKLKITEEERQLLSGFIGEDIGDEIDFNRLMPVVEKIEALGFCFSIQTSNVAVMKPYDIEAISAYDISRDDKKINVVYKVVVEFIKWYNQTLKP